MIKKNRAFTLIEVIVVAVITSSIFVVAISIYTRMIETRVDAEARQSLTESSYFMLERLNVLMSDFEIDYEEYFNRKIVGCSWDWAVDGDDFTWTGDDNWVEDWYCQDFTTYGNAHWNDNVNYPSDWKWEEYFCSSEDNVVDNPDDDLNWTPDFDDWWNYIVEDSDVDVWIWCLDDAPNNTLEESPQSYWQYENNFLDVWEDISWSWWVVGDDDDTDIGEGPNAIPDNENVQELYLINNETDERLLIRRNNTMSWAYYDLDSGYIDDEDDEGYYIDNLYNLEMLRLRGFEAGKEHDFDDSDRKVYEWDITTWACDYSQWFSCSWGDVGWSFDDYELPDDIDDWWVEIFGNDISVSDRNLEIYPTKDPDLAWREDDVQISPYIRVNIETRLYWEPWSERIDPEILDAYNLSLQTTFNVRENY